VVHASRQRHDADPHREVEVVGHETPGKNGPDVSRLDLTDEVDERRRLAGRGEHRLAARHAVADVMEPVFDEDPRPPRHRGTPSHYPNFFEPGTDRWDFLLDDPPPARDVTCP